MKILRGIFLVFTHVKFSPFLCIVILLLLFAGLIIPDALLASNVPQISTGSGHNLALKSDGTVWAWGYNEDGELGDGTNINKSTPVQIIGLSDIIAVAGGGYHSLALKSDGTVWAWGYNEDGELGDGTNINKNTPVQIIGLSDVIAIAGGGYHSLALKSDGTVWAWGYNEDGELGDGTNINKSTPVQIIGLSDVIAIAGGGYHSLALRSDGTVWAWGYNEYGQVGDKTVKDSRNTPGKIKDMSGVIAIAGGEYHSLALRLDGTVWAWGYNEDGELGDGTNVNNSTPVQAIGPGDIIAIACGGYHSLALKSDGTVWAWGYNEDGELGDGTNINKSTPVQIIGFSDVIAIAGGEYHSLALRLDGTVWAWGYNEDGQLGNGTNTDSNTPVQVNINLMVSKITSSIMLVPISDITFGESVTITGQIIPAQQEDRVIMTFTNSKGEIDTKTAESEVEGDFTLPDYSPISGGTWTVTASWEGNSDYSGAVSEPQTFIVNPAEIALTIETTSTIIQIDQTVDIAGIVTLTPDNETTRNKFLQETLSLFRINPDGSYEDIILTQPFLEEDQLTYIFKDVKLPGIGKWKLFNVFYEDESFIGAVSGNIEIEVRDAAKEVVGYAILVEGRIDNESGIDSHNRTANYINEKLIEMKFKDKNIHYFNFDDTQTGVDGKPVRDKILKTITGMSGDINMSPAPLYIIFVGPGDKEKIFIDPDDPITAGDLKGALNTLESQINSEALEKSPMVIVFGANHSGSFINALSKTGKKRVIIASSDTEEVAYKGPLPPDESIRHGDYFVSEFFKFAARGMSLKKCYEATANEIALFTNNENGNGLQGALAGNGRYFDNAAQHPVIDDNGDGIGTYGALSSISNSYKDGELAAKLVMGIETITSLELTEVTDVIKNLEVNTSPILFAKVNDSNKVDKVWIEIAGTNHRLSYHGTATVQQDIELPRFPPNKFEEGQYLWNDFDDNNEFNNFTDQGKYEIFYFGQDKNTGDATDLKISRVFRKAGGNPPPAFHAVYPVNGVKTAIALRFEWEINDNKTPIHKNNKEANDGTENEVVYYT